MKNKSDGTVMGFKSKSTKEAEQDERLCQNRVPSNRFDSNLTISELYKITGLTTLRFYLSTQIKEKCETVTSGAYREKSLTHGIQTNKENMFKDKIIDILSTESDCVLEDFVNLHKTNANDNFQSTVDNLSPSNLEGQEEAVSLTEPSNIPHNSDANDDYKNSDFLLAMNLRSQENATLLNETSNIVNNSSVQVNENPTIVLHRGHIFDELIEAFISPDISLELQIQLILPNGEPEVALECGGVFRDTLTEFWGNMYEKCTVGTNTRVPVLRHDFGYDKWVAIAKILLKGWQSENYFLVQLSNFDCKWSSTSYNILTLIVDIAHKELIQKPAYVTGCFNDIIHNMVTENQLKDIYVTSQPTSKNILSLIKFEDISTQNKDTVAGIVTKIDELNNNTQMLANVNTVIVQKVQKCLEIGGEH
ncbi:uncharacterized protein BDFB_007273 [Asbolus verrucosus]|uniref:Uncharacterized protein n=1 Tax=Asbolus verrucosus TaxID=1661398 RepID=A0A482VUP8_ASBVE|nr:uncharacterized protein BDFB_007273 [Asbolus verrucosus]